MDILVPKWNHVVCKNVVIHNLVNPIRHMKTRGPTPRQDIALKTITDMIDGRIGWSPNLLVSVRADIRNLFSFY